MQGLTEILKDSIKDEEYCCGRIIAFAYNFDNWTCPVCRKTHYRVICKWCGDTGLVPFAFFQDGILHESQAACNCDKIYNKEGLNKFAKSEIRKFFNFSKEPQLKRYFDVFKFPGDDVEIFNGEDYRYNFILNTKKWYKENGYQNYK